MIRSGSMFLRRRAALLCLLPALLLMCVLLSPAAAQAAAGESDIPDSYPSFTWNGYKLTPVHSDSRSDGFLVRIACDEMPLTLLYESREQFMLSGKNNGAALQAAGIRVMEGTLQKNELLESCEFFDLVFSGVSDLPGSLEGYEVTAEGADRGVPLPAFGSTDPSRCGFRTKSGLYVLSFCTDNTYKTLLEKYNDEWKNKDIRLCLGGTAFPSFAQDFSTRKFLNACTFSRVSLTLGHGLNLIDIEKPNRITDLTVSNDLIAAELPGLKKLTFRLGDGSWSLPEFAEDYPGLTELNVICCVRDPSAEKPWNYMRESNSTHERVAARLKKLTFLSPEDDPFTLDPDVRIWLIAQRDKTPGMTVNGTPAKKIDFTAGLRDEDRTRLVLPKDLKAVEGIYNSSLKNKNLKDREITADDIQAPVFFAVMKYGSFNVSTDGGKSYSYTNLSGSILAPELSEAKTIVFVYPSYKVTGTYYRSDTGKKYADAETCYTHIAVMSYQNGKAKLTAHHVAYKNEPPNSIGFSGSTQGQYYDNSAVSDIVDLLREQSEPDT